MKRGFYSSGRGGDDNDYCEDDTDNDNDYCEDDEMIRARFLCWAAAAARESTAEPLPRLLSPTAPFLHAC